MIAQLGQLCRGRIGVIARSSSMMFKRSSQRACEIGRILRADYLLEGSVRQEGDRVRITARLVETSGETHLWIETYERNLTDCLSVQADVAARIARSLAMGADAGGASGRRTPRRVMLGHTRATSKPASTGTNRATKGWTRRSTTTNSHLPAIPDSPPRTRGSARARILRAEYYGEVPRRVLELARHSAKRALELEPSLSEAHLAMAEIRRTLEWDWRGAESSYSQANRAQSEPRGRTQVFRA
jgi:hypothetical protein